MDGIESVKRFREFESQRAADDLAAGRTVRPRLLIVGMSANDDAEIREEAMGAGMNAWLTKPFTGDDFDRSVRLLQLNNAKRLTIDTSRIQKQANE
jgi:CheY-like chemotaxis protein